MVNAETLCQSYAEALWRAARHNTGEESAAAMPPVPQMAMQAFK